MSAGRSGPPRARNGARSPPSRWKSTTSWADTRVPRPLLPPRPLAKLEAKGGMPLQGLAMSKDRPLTPTDNKPATVSPRSEIESFLTQVQSLGPRSATGQRGRLIFALDATMSRQPTWNTARRLQGEMFQEAAASGGLDI